MEQPKNSKIKITKTEDTLEIDIPPARFRCYMTTVILGMEFIFSFPILLMAYGVYTAEFPYKIICAIFSLPFLAGAIGMGAFLPGFLFESTHINMDLKEIKITNKMFGSETDTPLFIKKDEIEKIIRTERHIHIRNPNTKYADAIDIRANIIFKVGKDEHKIRRYTSADLLEPELDWLAYEISNFLELPITYQSPQTA